MGECDECGRGVSLRDRLRRVTDRALRAIGLQVIPKPPEKRDPYQIHFSATSLMLDNWDYCMGEGRSAKPEDEWAYVAMNVVRTLLDDCVSQYWHKRFPEYGRFVNEAWARERVNQWFPPKAKAEEKQEVNA